MRGNLKPLTDNFSTARRYVFDTRSVGEKRQRMVLGGGIWGGWGNVLGIYHFNRTLQSCGSGRQDCINLTMRRIPRVNQEVLLRATFLGWSAGLFFRLGLGDERRPTGQWTPPRRGPRT